MIIVRFTSGLGNQMFQYSFYRFLKDLYSDVPVKADLTWFYANNDHNGYELERIFGKVADSDFSIEEATKGEIFKVTGLVPNMVRGGGTGSRAFEKFRRYPNRIIREFTQKKREPYIIDQLSGKICNEDSADGHNEMYEKVTHLDTAKDWYICGFWIEEKYLYGRLEEIRKQLRFPEIEDERNINLSDEIRSCNSVSIHVRRGDYLSATYENMFVSLGRDYYEKAVGYIKDRVDEPKFFIFSDDADFVRNEFTWLDDKCIVTGNEGDESFRDMQLMSLCKHNIIANSTFSQWGALLNENEGHMALYPAAYLKDRDNEVKKMPGWIRI
ncbi:MAG: alpha-1,2-fucosyltransferase [Lachnospiraceae bacterium]|nr:alpha-1,2-fucosyltransferase [Lachnospiraceae bacterium]